MGNLEGSVDKCVQYGFPVRIAPVLSNIEQSASNYFGSKQRAQEVVLTLAEIALLTRDPEHFFLLVDTHFDSYAKGISSAYEEASAIFQRRQYLPVEGACRLLKLHAFPEVEHNKSFHGIFRNDRIDDDVSYLLTFQE